MTFDYNSRPVEAENRNTTCEKVMYISGVQVRPAGLDGARLVAVGGTNAFQAHLDATRANYPNTRLLLSLSPDDNGWRYLSQDINGCQGFCQSVVDFLQHYDLDGLNLDAASYYAQLETQAISGSTHYKNLVTISSHDFDALLLGLKYQFGQAARICGQSYLLTQITNSTAPLLNHSYAGELACNSEVIGEMQTPLTSKGRTVCLSDKEAATLRGGGSSGRMSGVIKYHKNTLNHTQERDYFRYSRFVNLIND